MKTFTVIYERGNAAETTQVRGTRIRVTDGGVLLVYRYWRCVAAFTKWHRATPEG